MLIASFFWAQTEIILPDSACSYIRLSVPRWSMLYRLSDSICSIFCLHFCNLFYLICHDAIQHFLRHGKKRKVLPSSIRRDVVITEYWCSSYQGCCASDMILCTVAVCFDACASLSPNSGLNLWLRGWLFYFRLGGTLFYLCIEFSFPRFSNYLALKRDRCS